MLYMTENNPFCRLQLVVKRLDTQRNEAKCNKSSQKYKPTNNKTLFKTLGIINKQLHNAPSFPENYTL